MLAGCPYNEFAAFRTDIEGNYFKTLDLALEFAQRVRSGKQMDRFAGTVNTANFFRRPYGPGWALVGDAGYHKDPATAQGIADSFRDAEFVAEAINQGFSGLRPLAEALAEYEETRNLAVMPMYESSRSGLQILPNRPHRRCGNCCTLCAAIRPRPTDSSVHGRARFRFPSSSRQRTSSALSQANRFS